MVCRLMINGLLIALIRKLMKTTFGLPGCKKYLSGSMRFPPQDDALLFLFSEPSSSSGRLITFFLENAAEHLDHSPFINSELTFTTADLMNCGQNPFIINILSYITADMMAF